MFMVSVLVWLALIAVLFLKIKVFIINGDTIRNPLVLFAVAFMMVLLIGLCLAIGGLILNIASEIFYFCAKVIFFMN